MKQHCLTLDLKDDPELIRQYEEHHKNVWPEIKQSIREAGIEDMTIYRFGTRLFMVMEVNNSFRFEMKAEADRTTAKVQQWEERMWQYQQPLAQAAKGEKWMLMNKIFDLNES